jgi:hypothetical protein
MKKSTLNHCDYGWSTTGGSSGDQGKFPGGQGHEAKARADLGKDFTNPIAKGRQSAISNTSSPRTKNQGSGK